MLPLTRTLQICQITETTKTNQIEVSGIHSSHAIMYEILEEFYEDDDPPYSNYGFYSMKEEPELIDCFINVIHRTK